MSASIFDNMDKKSRKEFEKLPDEKKREVIVADFQKRISNTMTIAIAKSMIKGIETEKESLYKKYVENIDSCGSQEERGKLIESMLSYLRIEHLKFLKKQDESKNGG